MQLAVEPSHSCCLWWASLELLNRITQSVETWEKVLWCNSGILALVILCFLPSVLKSYNIGVRSLRKGYCTEEGGCRGVRLQVCAREMEKRECWSLQVLRKVKAREPAVVDHRHSIQVCDIRFQAWCERPVFPDIATYQVSSVLRCVYVLRYGKVWHKWNRTQLTIWSSLMNRDSVSVYSLG